MPLLNYGGVIIEVLLPRSQLDGRGGLHELRSDERFNDSDKGADNDNLIKWKLLWRKVEVLILIETK